MTEEELREKIAEIIRKPWYFTPVGIANQIVILIHEAGYRSPEEVDKMVEHRIYEMYANETYQPWLIFFHRPISLEHIYYLI